MMAAMPRRKSPAPPETATERVELRLTPTQLAAWRALAERKGMVHADGAGNLKALAVAAVDAYGAADAVEGSLADLGRDVIALVRARSTG
jgi:hypothetical protein